MKTRKERWVSNEWAKSPTGLSHKDDIKHRDLLAKFSIGKPKATDFYTEQELIDRKMIGIYEKVDIKVEGK